LKSRATLAIKGAIAVIVSALTGWWAFHDVDLAHVGRNLGNTTAPVLALYVLAQVVMHLSRVVRFGLLVQPLGRVTPRAIFAAVSVGLPASFFLPLRLGELVRPVMLTRSGVPFAGAFAAVAVERIADGLFNVGLFFLLLGTLPSDAIPAEARQMSWVALVGFGGGLIFLIAAYFARAPVLALLDKLVSPLSPTLAQKLIRLTTTFVDGLAALGSRARFFGFLFLTAFFWLLNGAATWLLANSYAGELPFSSGSFVICATVFAVMVPAGPAFVGTMELGFRLGLTPYGVGASEAAVIAVAAHAIHLVLMALFAGAGFLAAETSIKGVVHSTSTPLPSKDTPTT
jgi:glycosyltransferase 2 family protein